MKAAPTTYVLHYRNGRIRREGAGLSFLYYAPTSTIVAVPQESVDVLFMFQQVSADFQPVTVQGHFTYRVADPKRLAERLDFSILPSGAYRSDDPEELQSRLQHAAEVRIRAVTQRFPLKELLVGADGLVAEVLPALRADASLAMLGIEVLGFSVLAVKPTPEMARALEAEAREALQRRADEAIYARRNAAVEQERTIKESELSTEIAVEEKRRQIRETQMAAEVAIEEMRAGLIERRVENDRKDADGRSYALEATLRPLREVDWRTLMAVSAGGADPKLMIALAFRDLAANAEKIGSLNVTPDLLKSLLGK
jgi:regulator of protease activity HflC (stomatin/prohibitin superfamily)